MSVQAEGGQIQPDRVENVQIHDRGLWFDNAGGDMANAQTIQGLADIRPESGMVWEILAIDYQVTFGPSDAVASAGDNAHTNQFFLTWSLGTEHLSGVDHTVGSGTQPAAGEEATDTALNQVRATELDNLVLLKTIMGRQPSSSGATASDTKVGYEMPVSEGRWVMPGGNPYTLDFRSSLSFDVAYTVSSGNADQDDPVAFIEAALTFYVNTREARV